MCAVTVIFRIQSGQINAFLSAITANGQISRTKEVGCQQFDICHDGNEVFLYEIYDDRAAYDTHLASQHFKDFDAAAAPLIAEKHIRLFKEVIR